MDGKDIRDRNKQDDYHFATRGEHAPGRMATANSQAHSSNPNDSNNRDKKSQEFADMMQRLRELQIQLSQQAEHFQILLEQLMDDRAMALSVRDGLNDFLDEFRRTGEFDMGPDGYPMDPEIRKAIIDHEVKSGNRFEPYDTDAVADFVMSAIQDKDNEINSIGLRIDCS